MILCNKSSRVLYQEYKHTISSSSATIWKYEGASPLKEYFLNNIPSKLNSVTNSMGNNIATGKCS